MAKFIDISQQHFGELEVLNFVEDSLWKCRCSCGTIALVRSVDLRSGKSTKCKQHERLNILNTVRGGWYIHKKLDNSLYDCECINCHKHRQLSKAQTQHKYAVKCECQSKRDKLDDLSGKTFGYIEVIKYIGDKKYNCKCRACGKELIVTRANLTRNRTKSCSCKTNTLMKETILSKFGETNISKIKKPREKWQIDIVEDKDKLEKFIIEHSENNKIDISLLCEQLNLNRSNMWLKIHKHGLERYIDTDGSKEEKELLEFISKTYNKEIITNSRNIISPYELDIYIPDKS